MVGALSSESAEPSRARRPSRARDRCAHETGRNGDGRLRSANAIPTKGQDQHEHVQLSDRQEIAAVEHSVAVSAVVGAGARPEDWIGRLHRHDLRQRVRQRDTTRRGGAGQDLHHQHEGRGSEERRPQRHRGRYRRDRRRRSVRCRVQHRQLGEHRAVLALHRREWRRDGPRSQERRLRQVVAQPGRAEGHPARRPVDFTDRLPA